MTRLSRPIAVACTVLSMGCATTEPTRTVPPTTRVASQAPRRHGPAVTSTGFAAAVSQLLPYTTEGRSLEAIRTLYRIGQRRTEPGADEARYLAAAASADLAGYAEFRGETAMLEALGDIRGVGHAPAALYTALTAELTSVRTGVYAAAARGLADGVDLLRIGPRTERGIAVALQMMARHSAAAHLASLFYVDAVRTAVATVPATPAIAIARLSALGQDPCAQGCPGSSLASATEELRRAAAAVSRAYHASQEALAAGGEDPFAALVRSSYEDAKATLSRVALAERGSARGAPASRLLVEVAATEMKISLLPMVVVIDGNVDRPGTEGNEMTPRAVGYAPRWGAKVVPYEPFTQAAREVSAQATSHSAGANPSPPPVALVVNDELEAHVLARVILSLMAAGLDDVRLRRTEGGQLWEVPLHPVAAQRIDDAQTRGRPRVEIFGPFDYDGAARTLERHARAGRPASAQLVLFALIASRALYRALDAVRAAWPDAEPDIVLVLPAQVP